MRPELYGTSGDCATKYDLQFLNSRGIMTDAAERTSVIDGVMMRYAYCSATRMIYAELDHEVDSTRSVNRLNSQLMFDYAWILSDQVRVYRTFGDRREVVLGEPECCDPECHDTLVNSIRGSTIPDLFQNSNDYRLLGSEIWRIILQHAESMDSSRPLRDRLLEVMDSLNEALLTMLSRRPGLCMSDPPKRRIGNAKKRVLAKELRERLEQACSRLSSSGPQDNRIAPDFLNWIHENIMCSLLNAPSDSSLTVPRPRGLKHHNRRTGSYYTPDHITWYIAANTLGHWLMKRTGIDLSDPEQLSAITEEQRQRALNLLLRVKIVDPAVGGGVFLLAAAQWLETARLILRDQLPRDHIRASIVNENLYGVDIMTGAVQLSRTRLKIWYLSSLSDSSKPQHLRVDETIRCGNSLIDSTTAGPHPNGHRQGKNRNERTRRDCESRIPPEKHAPFDWISEFSEVMTETAGGFDIVIGNPPYGNILGDSERRLIAESYGGHVSGGDKGTWNSAALFIVRAKMLLKAGGEMGFIVPNSILRVGQFTKTRTFLLEHMKMREIVDEGSPFEGVTLEMVSIFCTSEDDRGGHDVRIVSRRPGLEGVNSVPWDVLKSGRIFVIYYDDILARILERSARSLMNASRGKDIPKNHVSERSGGAYIVPYATKGRSVKRYAIGSDYLTHADEWFKQDDILMDSYSNQFLIATKNYPYPRCLMKPRGMIHGGGAVRIQPTDQGIDPEALGAILNSRVARYVCRRYLTNYSQLTTCMNTGIFEDMPIVYPKEDKPLILLFRSLSELYGKEGSAPGELKARMYLENVTDAITYSLYLGSEHGIIDAVTNALNNRKEVAGAQDLYEALSKDDIERHVRTVLESSAVKRIESSPFMSAD